MCSGHMRGYFTVLWLFRAELGEADVAAGIAERAAARAAKDFAAADAVRLRLAERGILLMDSPAGTTWRSTASCRR